MKDFLKVNKIIMQILHGKNNAAHIKTPSTPLLVHVFLIICQKIYFSRIRPWDFLTFMLESCHTKKNKKIYTDQFEKNALQTVETTEGWIVGPTIGRTDKTDRFSRTPFSRASGQKHWSVCALKYLPCHFHISSD